MIVGIDEVGRGAWAVPLCVGAVALGDVELPGLTDSKKLTMKKRIAFDKEIKKQAPLVGIGWVSARDIDRIGMSQALKLAAKRAFDQIDCVEISQIIIDGTIMLLDDPRATTMKQADLLVPSVSAASVIAKVARDNYMASLDELFPGYGFSGHVGYGTAKHMAGIEILGATPLHRMSFAPLKTKNIAVKVPAPITDGVRAEEAGARHLASLGYEIIERNWKTKWCEVDIIARKDDRLHFVEVKYRRNSRHGDGLAAITPQKVRQMTFAAELWLKRNTAHQPVLSALSLSGDDFSVDEFIDVIV